MMLAVVKKPGEYADPIYIDNSLEALQDAVGGYIEVVTVCSDLAIICNEEGRLLSLPHNCNICGVDFCGTILAVGVKGEEFCGIPFGKVSKVMKMLFGGDGNGND